MSDQQKKIEVSKLIEAVPLRWPGAVGWPLMLLSLSISIVAFIALPDIPDRLEQCSGDADRIEQIINQSHTSVLLAMTSCVVAFLAFLPRYRYWLMRQGAVFIFMLPVLLIFAWTLGFGTSFDLVVIGIPAVLLLGAPVFIVLNRRYHIPPHERSVRPTFAANTLIVLLMVAPISMLISIPQLSLGC